MQTRLICLVSAAFLLAAPAGAQALPGNGHAQSSASIYQSFKNEVHRLVVASAERWAEAWQRNDVDGVMEAYTRRAAIVAPDGSMARAEAERAAMFRDWMARTRECRLNINDFDVSGDLAVAAGTTDCEVEQEGRGVVRERAVFSLVLRQQGDGSWLIQSHVMGAPTS